MSVWEDLVKLVEAGDVPGTARLVSALGPADRQTVAAELPRCLAALDTGPDGPRRRLAPLLVAGAGCVSGPAGVAAWLFRREFEDMNGYAGSIVALLRQRPLEWQADVARRLARRMRLPFPRHWSVVAGLVRESGLAPPDDDAFKVGWLRGLGPVTAVRDPFFRSYAPHIFEFDGLGEVLPWQTGTIARLVQEGLLDRAAVLDGVVGRLLRDGPAAIDALVELHDLLDPDLDETSARAADYVRLLPAAPTRVAVMALARLRRLEEAGRAADELFAGAVAALAFRPEKKVLTETLSWAGEATRRRPDLAGAALCGLSPLFTHDALALQDRAVRLAVRLAPHADASAREAVREAAAGLPAGLREKVAAAYGAIAEEAALDVPELVPPEGLRLPPPVGSPSELAHALAAYSAPHDRHGHDFERLLSALAEWSARAPGALREALLPWWQPFDPRAFGDYDLFVQVDLPRSLLRAFLAFASPEHSRKLGHEPEQVDGRRVLARLPFRRAAELAATFEEGRAYPVLLATPTAATGHVDPGVLLDRLARLEAAGVAALPADLAQALFRLPRVVDPAVVARAEGLTSEAGRICASWMRAGGLRDPEVSCRVLGRPALRVVPEISAGDPPALVPDLFLLRDGRAELITWWPSVLPSHREVVAAHLLCHLPYEIDQPRSGAGVLPELVRGDGPVGIATAYALACGLGQAAPEGRAAATDALLTLAARGETPVADLADALTELVASAHVKLNRVAAALDDAARAGGHEVVWAVIVRLLPALLPGDGERPRAGLADLLAAGARAARAAGARADLPTLAAIAGRKGTSRLVQEARRLAQLIA